MSSVELSFPNLTMEDVKPNEDTATSPKACRRPRTSEDFYLFCTYVLEYENYDAQKNEEIRNISNQSPPLDSSGSSINSESTNSGHEEDKPSGDEIEEGDSFDLVTCFCGKPFAGRPMIECSLCLTWIHLSCARIKKTQIPEVFHCAMCVSTKKQRSPSPTESVESSLKRPKRST